MKTLFVKGVPPDIKAGADSIKEMADAFGNYSQSLTVVTGYSHEFHQQLKKLAAKKSRFERFYDKVSNFLSGGKSFLPRELKSH